MTKILTLAVKTDDGCAETHYGVEHEGKLWLVTAWLSSFATNTATPQRMIRIDDQPIKKCEPGGQFDYTDIFLPRDVIEGEGDDLHGCEVRSFPDAPVVHRDALKVLPSVFPRH